MCWNLGYIRLKSFFLFFSTKGSPASTKGIINAADSALMAAVALWGLHSLAKHSPEALPPLLANVPPRGFPALFLMCQKNSAGQSTQRWLYHKSKCQNLRFALRGLKSCSRQTDGMKFMFCCVVLRNSDCMIFQENGKVESNHKVCECVNYRY